MIKLIQNENMKTFKRPFPLISLISLVIIALAAAIILNNLNANPSNAWEFMVMSSQIMQIASLLTIVVASSIISSEFSWGTIKMLLVKPVSRFQILFAKYISTLIFALLLFLTIMGSAFIFGTLFFGTSNSAIGILDVLKEYGIILLDALMWMTFAFMISSILRNTAIAITLSFILATFGSAVVELLSTLDYQWGKFILFANTDLSQYQDGRSPYFESMSITFSIIVNMFYLLLFIVIAYVVFKKRDIAV